jgi:hypothetical protein
MKDVTGFNKKTQYVDGEKLIKEGLDKLSNTYSSKLIDLLKKMLIFDEEKRPNFIELAKMIFVDKYVPRVDVNLQEMSSNSNKTNIA